MKFFLKVLGTLVFIVLGTHRIEACMNEYRTLLSGEVVFTDGHSAAPRARFNRDDMSYLLKHLREAETRYKTSGSIQDYSDLGTMLVYTGNYAEAKKIFLAIERKSPGLYVTAANLGTTYELMGKNDSALTWIKRALELNQDSHHASEWIHVKLLEAKIAAKGDANALRNSNMLSLDFGDKEIPENKSGKDLSKLQKDLYYQLNERLSFVKPEDPVVASLLFDLGNTVALTRDATAALEVYRLAASYGNRSPLFEKRLSYFDDLNKEAEIRSGMNKWKYEHHNLYILLAGTGFIVCMLVVLLLLWFSVRLLKRKVRRVR